MARAVETVIVDRPIEVVFAFLADGSNNSKWRPRVVNTIFASGPVERAVWAQTSRRPNGREYATDYRISWYDEPTRLEYTVFAGPARPIGVYTLRTAAHGSTEVTLTVDLTPRWMLLPISSFGRRAADAEAVTILSLPTAIR
jgi:uncharacterized protein YndB with AHSA1/START domain